VVTFFKRIILHNDNIREFLYLSRLECTGLFESPREVTNRKLVREGDRKSSGDLFPEVAYSPFFVRPQMLKCFLCTGSFGKVSGYGNFPGILADRTFASTCFLSKKIRQGKTFPGRIINTVIFSHQRLQRNLSPHSHALP